MSGEQLGSLIDEHSAALTLLARSLCDCPDDVVQEAFIRLSQQDVWPDSPKAWLYRVVRNQAYSARRAARRRSNHESSAADRKPSWFASNVENLVDGRTAAEALQHLSDQHREVVILRMWSRLTFQEIGDVIETSDSTAQRRYVEALDTLRQRLEPTCPKNPENQSPNSLTN